MENHLFAPEIHSNPGDTSYCPTRETSMWLVTKAIKKKKTCFLKMQLIMPVNSYMGSPSPPKCIKCYFLHGMNSLV
jgi:hypothetical protein